MSSSLHAPRTTHHAVYRGRLAPSPTGFLHLGHARTFWFAQQRALSRNGTMIFRNEDLDRARCKPEFVTAMFDDLKWFGFNWQEGPDCGGQFKPYSQSERMSFYRAALDQLRATGHIYPCTCSRKDIADAARAPHAEDEDEPIYAGTCRSKQSYKLDDRAEQPATFNLQPASLGASESPTAKPFPTPTTILARNRSSPEKTSAIS